MTSRSAVQEQSNAGRSSILRGKRAIIFGAGGSVGSAVAGEFAAEGAEVYLAGRNQASGAGLAAVCPPICKCAYNSNCITRKHYDNRIKNQGGFQVGRRIEKGA